MLVFCIFIISTMTLIKTQKTVDEKLNESSDWKPKIELTRKTSSSKNHEEPLKKGEVLKYSNTYNFHESHKKLIDAIKEKGQNETGYQGLIAPRFLHNRAQIDRGGKSLNGENTSSKIKHASFEVLSTNIPLIETFRNQFLEKKARNGTHGDNRNQNKSSMSVKKEGTLPDGKLWITENDAVTVKLETSKSNQIQEISKTNKLFDVEKHRLKETKIEVDGNLTEGELGYNGSMKTQMTGITPKQEEENVAPGSVIEIKAKSEEDPKKLSPNLAKFKNLEPKLAESKGHAKREWAPSKNDSELTNYLARFRKQISDWENKGPISSLNPVLISPPTPQTHLKYSTLPLRLPEPLPHYRADYYSPTEDPVKKTQPYPSQYFKPAIPHQSFLLDRPPNFGPFKRQDEEIDQFYPPAFQGYSNPPMKNNSYYNVPLVNYYYPSVSYQPKQPPQQELELTTQGYPPSQVYQVPSYHYGPPDPSLSYGPPQPIPGELSPLQEQKPYFSQNFIRISLNDEQCVMSREIAAEAAIQVSLSFGSKRSQLRKCALMFASGFNIAVSSMIRSDQNATTVDLVRQLNLKMFSVQPTGHVLEIKFPWYLDDKSPGLALGDSGTIIITFQPSTSLAFRFLIFSYRDTIPRMPVIVSYVLTANATEPLNETNHTNHINQTDQTEAPAIEEKFVPVSLEQEPVIFKVL